jgi:exopolyphosphatase/guanosine-5'-triphosphate,3'-diphosphate pyrophosphatase
MADSVALLDLGSNAVRFLLVQVTPGAEYRVLREERIQTRLGDSPSGQLPARAVRDTLRGVRRFLQDVRNGQDPRVVAIATAAVREASNAEDLLGPLRREDGVAVRVLSWEEEARLGAVAVVRSLPFRRGIVADLGGGSLQLTQVHDDEIQPLASLPLGAVRATRRHLHRDPPDPDEIVALRREVWRHVLPVLPKTTDGKTMAGVGGTIRTLARLHLAGANGQNPSRHGLRIDRGAVTALRARLEVLPTSRREELPGLKAERADIIVAGAVVVEELMAIGGFPALTICMQGVRDGLLICETFKASAAA